MPKYNIVLDGRRWSENRIIQEILKSRGIYKLSDEFLYPEEGYIYPNECFKNIKKAGKIFSDGIKEKRRFFVYYDVDQDGISSGTIISKYLEMHGISSEPYINDGKEHGISSNFNYEILENFDIVVIVDSIEDDMSSYERILSMGKKIIVLDHHIIPREILSNQSKINLVSSANDYPNPSLSGAGVCLKFVCYIDEILGTDYAYNFFDLAATGIVADMCSVGVNSMENRAICNIGFTNQKNLGILNINGNYPFNSNSVSFGIAPLVNSANRTHNNKDAMMLFLSNDVGEIKTYIKTLKKYKEEQNKCVCELYDSIKEDAESQRDNDFIYLIVKGNSEILGLIANKIMSEYKKPCLMLRETEDGISGSFRSPTSVDLNKIINSCEYGTAYGHENAGGVFIKKEHLEDFLKELSESLKYTEFDEFVNVDVKLLERQITSNLIKSLKEINRISGMDFPPITVMIEDVTGYKIGSLSGGKHLKIDTENMSYIKWNFNNWDDVKEDMSMCSVGVLDESFFGKKYTKQLILNDLQFTEKFDI